MKKPLVDPGNINENYLETDEDKNAASKYKLLQENSDYQRKIVKETEIRT